jgi:hypothetical protein
VRHEVSTSEVHLGTANRSLKALAFEGTAKLHLEHGLSQRNQLSEGSMIRRFGANTRF